MSGLNAERSEVVRVPEGLDIDELRKVAQGLVDLVLTDDCVFLDSLPDELESNVVTPLTLLARVLNGPDDPVELIKAAHLVKVCAKPTDACPAELNELLRQLPW